MAVNFMGGFTNNVMAVPSITVTDNDGNTKTYYEKKNGDYLVISKNQDGHLESSEVLEKADALEDFVELARDEDTESISYKSEKGSKTTVSYEDGKYEVQYSGFSPFVSENTISKAGAMFTVLRMLENVDMLEKKPVKIYNMEYSA